MDFKVPSTQTTLSFHGFCDSSTNTALVFSTSGPPGIPLATESLGSSRMSLNDVLLGGGLACWLDIALCPVTPLGHRNLLSAGDKV